ncbi:hypothetical protein AQUCO_01800221v1 [Aquilegia coerulea]|uniref:Chloroplast envelope membrane protein n=1 Tax=Aquilegia coerulea TaxID=218851 RepID=A0A2G5DKG1_AQUCA|nr:hypothetical protein AQUCO_01800221v1 [Aquilegia coerulea]
MFLMSTSMVLLCNNFVLYHSPNLLSGKRLIHSTFRTSSNSLVLLGSGRKRHCRVIVNANSNDHHRNRTWWQKFFFDDDGNWLGLRDDDMVEEPESSSEDELSEEERFEAWRRRAEAITELREAQEDISNAQSRKWEDWLIQGSELVDNKASWGQDWADGLEESTEHLPTDPSDMMSGNGLLENIRALVVGNEDDDFTYEDRVFQYASSNSAKFLTLLVIVPWALDFVVHDYVLMPFLDRYVKTVPLAAEVLDVRRNQKLKMVDTLKVEKARFRFEAEIGKSPSLSDEEVWSELRHKALELRDEWRLENRRAFANIWSDMVFGITLFILLYFNQSKVALLKFTGYKIINNVSDTGKAFLIILITDIFLGYHSESGWQTLVEIFIEHYGFEIDEAAITIFICLVPVILDACVKLWVCYTF